MTVYKLTEAGIPEWLKVRFDHPVAGPEGQQQDWIAYAIKTMAEQLPQEHVCDCRTGMLIGNLLDDGTSVPVVICNTEHGDYLLVYASWRPRTKAQPRKLALA